MKKQCMRFAALLCFLVTAAGTAHSEGFSLYEYSARGIALGGAMMARKPDASVVAYNPALLTRLPGMHAMVGASIIQPQGDMDWKDGAKRGNTELRDSVWAIPHAYFTWQINERWFFGIGEFSRFGLGFEYPHSWPGRFNIYQVSLKSGSLNPNIAWKATDKLSLAVGVELVYVDLDIKKRNKVYARPGVLPDYFEVDANIHKADDFGIGANVALHYQFNDQWAFGVQYRSPVRVHAHGDVMFSYKEAALISGMVPESALQQAYKTNFKDGTAHSTVVLPESVQAGIAWSPTPKFSIEVDAIWTRWSRFHNLNIHMPHDLPVSENKKHWKDVWRLSAGVEYQALDWLTLRAGYVYDESPMTEQYRDYLVPTADRHIYSVGVGLKYEQWTLDVAYAYIDAIGRSYRASNRTHVLDSDVKTSTTNVVSVSLSYEF